MSLAAAVSALVLSATEPLPPDVQPTPAQDSDGTLLGGSSQEPKKKKKKKKKGGKKKKKKGGKKQASKHRNSTPWAGSDVVVGGGAAFMRGFVQEAPAFRSKGDPDEDDIDRSGGTSSTSCTGNSCETIVDGKNGTTGWGQETAVRVVLPGVGEWPRWLGPSVAYTRKSVTTQGRSRSIEGDATSSLQATQVSDQATYALNLNAVQAGVMLALSGGRKKVPFFWMRTELGYTWGDVVTTRTQATEATGTVRGMTGGFDVGVGARLGRHAQLYIAPFSSVDFMGLYIQNPASFPYLSGAESRRVEDRSSTSSFSAMAELTVSF